MHDPAFRAGLSGDLLRDAGLARVEQVQSLVHRIAHGALGLGVDIVAVLESGFDGLGEIGSRHETSSSSGSRQKTAVLSCRCLASGRRPVTRGGSFR